MAVGTGKNDPAGPRRDSSGRNASSASSPSRGGYNGARSGGNLSSNGLGIRTGSTIRGNTAFGPAGGMAQGYATNSRLGSGMGPSIGSFSNFRNTDGSAMFGGGLQNRAIAAKNPQQALGMLQALKAAQGSQRPSAGRVGGLLDGEQVTVGPTTVQPAAASPVARIKALLGGGGMVGYGLNPAGGGAWSPAALQYYGGYRAAAPKAAAPLTNKNAMLGGGGMSAYGNWPSGGGSWSPAAQSYYGGYKAPGSIPDMPRATGEESIR